MGGLICGDPGSGVPTKSPIHPGVAPMEAATVGTPLPPRSPHSDSSVGIRRCRRKPGEGRKVGDRT
eukprot:8475244-Alexandrium_andersonii.AAC.1